MIDTTEKLKYSEGNRFLLEMAFLELADLFAADRVVAQAPKAESKAVPASTPTRAKATRKDDADPMWLPAYWPG